MKKTGYSEIDAMFTTSSLSEELSVYVAFYNEYSKIEIKNLKNTYESFKDAKKMHGKRKKEITIKLSLKILLLLKTSIT